VAAEVTPFFEGTHPKGYRTRTGGVLKVSMQQETITGGALKIRPTVSAKLLVVNVLRIEASNFNLPASGRGYSDHSVTLFERKFTADEFILRGAQG